MWMKLLTVVLLFFILANPMMFKVMRGLLGGWIASAEGLPKPAGLLLHAIVFALATRVIMRMLWRRKYYSQYEDEAEKYEDEAEKYEEAGPESYDEKEE
jgi:hypothetical protein